VSRTLKRPMFRRGGQVNDGIMTGIVDRTKKQTGGLGIDRDRTEAEIKMLMDLQNEYAPVAKTRLPIGQFGLNLASGQFAGDGLLSNIAGSLRDPLTQFTRADDARKSILDKRKTSALSTSIGQQFAERTARAKAAGQGMQKDYSPQRAYEDLVKTRTESKSKLQSFQKPNIEQAYPRATSEYDIIIERKLRTTTDPTGKMIAANNAGFVPFDSKSQSFDYNAMRPGAFYYDPRIKAFVQRIPPSDEDEGGFFIYDKNTFAKRKIETNT